MRRFFALLILMLVFAGCSSAQLVYTAPQTVQARLFNAVAVAGVSTNPQNISQSVHYLTYTTSVATAIVRIRLEGSQDGVTYFPISEDAVDAVSGGVFAFGYYPFVRANLLTFDSAGTLTAFYAGTSTTAGPPAGVFNQSQGYRKVIFSNGNPQATQTITFTPPFGSTGGVVYISSSGTLGVTCQMDIIPVEPALVVVGATQNFAPGNATFSQFIIAPVVATKINLIWTACGGAQTTFNLNYIFFPPTAESIGKNAVEISTVTTTVVKNSAGILNSLMIGLGAAGTIGIYDVFGSGCVGTPASGRKGIITTTAAQAPVTLPLGIYMRNGICITTVTAVGNITVVYQ